MDFPTFLLTLLSGNWLFFKDDEIAWDGKHHEITGIQVNAVQVDQLMEFVNSNIGGFDDIVDVVNHFVLFMNELEKDEDLIIPAASIAPGIRKALREGDLTGITLANLAACGAAFQVKLQAEDDYVVIYDTRLSLGIPLFFDLIARLLWDLRQWLNSKQGVPFSVTFMGARNFDANKYLDDVPKKVIGAQENPFAMRVYSCPMIDTKSFNVAGVQNLDESEARIETFCSGFDFPNEMQADEDLFDANLLYLCRSFPMSIPIEGTHVHGRAERIEAIKVGDSLTLAADWQTRFFHPVGIEVFNQSGETLGYLKERLCVFDDSGNRDLACLLPFITAFVESVTPLSQRRKNAKYAKMEIRLELDERLIPREWDTSINEDALKAIKALLARPKPQRVILSRSNLSPKQLMGSIDTSMALDDPYGSLDFCKPLSTGKSDLSFSDGFGELSSEISVHNQDGGDPAGRDLTVSLLQLSVKTAQLSGTEFPQEFLDQLEKAAEGDDSIDVEELMEQFNNATPDIHKTDFNNISFMQNRRVDGRRFSIAVPDNWSILKDVEDNTLSLSIARSFIILPHEPREDDVSFSDRIMYSSLAGDIDDEDDMLEIGIPAMQWALRLYTTYVQTDALGVLRKPFIWDDEVQAFNTKCFVAITSPNDGPNGLDLFIYPYAFGHKDFLRGTFYYDENTDLEQIKKLAIEIAQSVKLDDPFLPICEKTLEKALHDKVNAEEYVDMVTSFSRPFIGLKQMVFESAQKRYIDQSEEIVPPELMLSGARGIVEFTDRALPILSNLIDAYIKQISLGANEVDASKMRESLASFDSLVFPTTNLFSDEPEIASFIDKAGIFDPSIELQRLRSRLQSLPAEATRTVADGSSFQHSQTSGVAFNSENAHHGHTNGAAQDGSKNFKISASRRKAKIESEKIKLNAFQKIIEALSKRISVNEFVSICQLVGFDLAQRRQYGCSSVMSPMRSPEDNATAMCQEFGRFNHLIARYVGYMLDVVEMQKELGASYEEVVWMANEVMRLMSLISNYFFCGNPYLDSIANSRAPIVLPSSINELYHRINGILGGR